MAGAGKKRDLASLLGTGGGKRAKTEAGVRSSGSILERARAAVAHAKRAETNFDGIDDDARHFSEIDRGTETRRADGVVSSSEPTRGSTREPKQKPSRWDAEEKKAFAASTKSRWGDDAENTSEEDDEELKEPEPTLAIETRRKPESYVDKMVREAAEFKAANERVGSRRLEDRLEAYPNDRSLKPASNVNIARIVAARTPSSSSDANDDGREDLKRNGDAGATPVAFDRDADSPPRRNDLKDLKDLKDLEDLEDLEVLEDRGDGTDGESRGGVRRIDGRGFEAPLVGDFPLRPARSPSPERATIESDPSGSPSTSTLSNDRKAREEDSRSSVPRVFDATATCRSVFDFEQLNKIDEGTYGVVFRARDKKTNEVYALKKVKMEKEREGFPVTALREANILLSMSHPNIVNVSEMVVGNSLDSVFMVMEFCEHDLKGLMETMRRPFSVSEVKCLTRQLLGGVAYMHENWTVHRDLKTSNVLINNEGQLKICDFGLARQYGDPLGAYTPTVVTLWYRAPEVLLGARSYGPQIDVWSLGCILAELLHSEPLFTGKTEMDQLGKMFGVLGVPNETVWPGFSKLPGVHKVKFPHQPYNFLRKKFPENLLSDLGFDLLNRMLAYDPNRRISAEEALGHPFFDEFPPAKQQRLMPTFPSRAGGDLVAGVKKMVADRNRHLRR